ncbi:MAG: hypothetical protein ACJAUG_002653 [Halioglobus sp.]|jgi:hypothetical protein
MKMIYTHENRFFVANAKNILEANDFDIIVKNEFASSAIGEVSPFDSWVELWLPKDSDYDKACEVINGALSKESDAEWVCVFCAETNDASFELCWNCQNDATATTPRTT